MSAGSFDPLVSLSNTAVKLLQASEAEPLYCATPNWVHQRPHYHQQTPNHTCGCKLLQYSQLHIPVHLDPKRSEKQICTTFW